MSRQQPTPPPDTATCPHCGQKPHYGRCEEQNGRSTNEGMPEPPDLNTALDRPQAAQLAFRAMNCDGSSGHPDLELAMANLYCSAFQIWKRRQRKYGTGN